MEKYAVQQRKDMQRSALTAVQREIRDLTSCHEKTAEAEQGRMEKLERLRQQERELQEALADQNDG